MAKGFMTLGQVRTRAWIKAAKAKRRADEQATADRAARIELRAMRTSCKKDCDCAAKGSLTVRDHATSCRYALMFGKGN